MKNKKRDGSLTILGKETVFDGVLQFSDSLKIDGKFIGAIDSQGSLEISKSADCRVQYVKAASIEVSGSVVGSLTAADKIDLKTGCFVKGDLTAGRIRIADKVSFEGAVRMLRNNKYAEKNPFSIKTDQLKEQLRSE